MSFRKEEVPGLGWAPFIACLVSHPTWVVVDAVRYTRYISLIVAPKPLCSSAHRKGLVLMLMSSSKRGAYIPIDDDSCVADSDVITSRESNNGVNDWLQSRT